MHMKLPWARIAPPNTLARLLSKLTPFKVISSPSCGGGGTAGGQRVLQWLSLLQCGLQPRLVLGAQSNPRGSSPVLHMR